MNIKLLLLLSALAVINAQLAHNAGSFLYSQHAKRQEAPFEPHYSYAANYFDFSADFDFSSASYQVPPVPLNNSATNLEFAVILQTSVTELSRPAATLASVLLFSFETDTWQIASCACQLSGECNCSVDGDVNVGDTVSVSISRQNDIWTLLATSGTAETRKTAPASGMGILGHASFQWAQKNVKNCNNLPPSNGIIISNVVIKNRGIQLTNIPWNRHELPNHCSQRVIYVSDTKFKIGWNSNNWIGNQIGACTILVVHTPKNSWIQDGKSQTHYLLNISNFSEEDITDLSFTLGTEISQIWNVEENDDGSYDVPDYAFPLTSRETFNSGYIAEQKTFLKEIYCQGGHQITVGEQPGFVHEDIPYSPEECSVEFEQNIVSTWTDNEGQVSHVSVQLKNTGSRVLSNIDFTSSQVSSIEQSWVVEEIEEGHFGLPSWSPSLLPGSSISFGYIVRGTQALTFESSLLCN